MPRRKRILKRRMPAPDAKFGNVIASRFINSLLYDGKKSVAERIFYRALDQAQSKAGKPGLQVLLTAMDNVKPEVEVKSRRVGGATYQVPVEVLPARRESLAIRWMIFAARERNNHGMVDALSGEILDAYNRAGGAFKKKEDVHKMAEANKAFAHYRW
ncbi:MAG: 30S ribosomal protein S7 [Candidatus Lindowbacteria bacterium RIFCSPLOWO2_12_FULL_62_27]|nr:MAG: 30S ribosomal protein S7 [Candidatus Lindowbacteria bacterium RIFCSPLOWO2_12_FULL_62_27]